MDKFVTWAKSGGTKSDDDNPGNQKFLDWAKNAKSMVVPILKDNSFHLHSLSVDETRPGSYIASYINFYPDASSSAPMSYKRLSVSISSLTKDQAAKGVDYLAEKLILLNKEIPKTDVKTGKGSPWGEFRYADAKGTRPSIAWFLHDSFFILINVGEGGYQALQTEPWHNDYFNYFDLKTVSLQ